MHTGIKSEYDMAVHRGSITDTELKKDDSGVFKHIPQIVTEHRKQTFITGNVCGVKYDPAMQVLVVDTVVSSKLKIEGDVVGTGVEHFARTFNMTANYAAMGRSLNKGNKVAAHHLDFSPQNPTHVKGLPAMMYNFAPPDETKGEKEYDLLHTAEMHEASQFVRWYMDADCFEPRVSSASLLRFAEHSAHLLAHQVIEMSFSINRTSTSTNKMFHLQVAGNLKNSVDKQELQRQEKEADRADDVKSYIAEMKRLHICAQNWQGGPVSVFSVGACGTILNDVSKPANVSTRIADSFEKHYLGFMALAMYEGYRLRGTKIRAKDILKKYGYVKPEEVVKQLTNHRLTGRNSMFPPVREGPASEGTDEDEDEDEEDDAETPSKKQKLEGEGKSLTVYDESGICLCCIHCVSCCCV
jgi:hypothetical protein